MLLASIEGIHSSRGQQICKFIETKEGVYIRGECDSYRSCRDTENIPLRVLLARQHYTAALLIRLGVPSTLIRHENEAFRKRSSANQSNLKTPTFRFNVKGKRLMMTLH